MYNQSNKPSQGDKKPQGELNKKDGVVLAPAANAEVDKSLKAPIEAPAVIAKEGVAKLTPATTGDKPSEAAVEVRKS